MIKKLIKPQPQKVTRKEMYVLQNQRIWKQKGALLRKMRKEAGISVANMAAHLKVSSRRLYRFEAGEPVRDAKLIEASYINVMRYGEVKILLLQIINLMEGAGLNDSHRIE